MKRATSGQLVLFSSFLLGATSGSVTLAQGSPQPPTQDIVVVDVTKDRLSGLKDRLLTVEHPSGPLTASLREFLAPAPATEQAIHPNLAEQKTLLSNLSSEEAVDSELRLVSRQRDVVTIILLRDAADEDDPKVTHTQTARLSRLSQDLKKLLSSGLPAEIGLAADAPDEQKAPTVRLVTYPITLVHRRADLAVKTMSVPRGTAKAAEITETSCEKGDCVRREFTVTCGPPEHFFLSLDLPVTKASEVKFDRDSHTLRPKDVPTTFFVGIDFMVGDLLSKPKRFGTEGIVLKAFIKAAKEPSDSYGVGIGYRPPDVDFLGLELDSIQLFGAYIWNREDTANGTRTGKEYKGKIRGGLSFNLDKLSEWLKKGK